MGKTVKHVEWQWTIPRLSQMNMAYSGPFCITGRVNTAALKSSNRYLE